METNYPLQVRPEIETLHTGTEQAFALTVWFEHDIIPLCDNHATQPPADIKKRDFEHKKLSETMPIGMLKMDGIETGGAMMLRNARKDRMKRLQQALLWLDEAAMT
ncbi:uncharacterized protein N7500_004391 [Penicillium coprophilum]|uniref:uncharacterized protein n=1 Tax=Penicillium coprophilum TaxID=36646 RepID=UPI00239FA719|nr:uncharacterized protein N7500_004391 [Penicillium coprophilum]KAJ5162561.1 hypothetical protein N7500_004391 [Penicillium coprophilum]